jgi:hypothetical protein
MDPPLHSALQCEYTFEFLEKFNLVGPGEVCTALNGHYQPCGRRLTDHPRAPGENNLSYASLSLMILYFVVQPPPPPPLGNFPFFLGPLSHKLVFISLSTHRFAQSYFDSNDSRMASGADSGHSRRTSWTDSSTDRDSRTNSTETYHERAGCEQDINH